MINFSGGENIPEIETSPNIIHEKCITKRAGLQIQKKATTEVNDRKTGHETTHPLTPASLVSLIDLGSQDLDLVFDLLDLLINRRHLQLVLLVVRLRLSLLVDKMMTVK